MGNATCEGHVCLSECERAPGDKAVSAELSARKEHKTSVGLRCNKVGSREGFPQLKSNIVWNARLGQHQRLPSLERLFIAAKMRDVGKINKQYQSAWWNGVTSQRPAESKRWRNTALFASSRCLAQQEDHPLGKLDSIYLSPLQPDMPVVGVVVFAWDWVQVLLVLVPRCRTGLFSLPLFSSPGSRVGWASCSLASPASAVGLLSMKEAEPGQPRGIRSALHVSVPPKPSTCQNPGGAAQEAGGG
ncbi:hypothetical protein VTI74DRAFT_6058 [Chaetomium olivicolor]